jgi:hypothetical protein
VADRSRFSISVPCKPPGHRPAPRSRHIPASCSSLCVARWFPFTGEHLRKRTGHRLRPDYSLYKSYTRGPFNLLPLTQAPIL